MKKILILTLAVLSFAACDQVAKFVSEQNGKAQNVQNRQGAQIYILSGLNADSYSFNEKINEKPVVVAFMAGFCGWCKKMLPYMDNLAGQVPSTQADVIIAFMDGSSSSLVNLEPVKAAKNIKIYYNAKELMQEYGVRGFPTIMLFKDGKPVQTWRGYSPEHVDSILETLKNLK
ncbi:MAG: thioredoxin family protein [Elusimicrobiaceae bacterium]|nr:thioredoxin family protein [Elusimicrobiaceae bacterium]